MSLSYGYTKTLENRDFDQVLTDVEAALKTEGFGILTEIDVKATLKKKLDLDFRRYRILGACNPKLAHGALSTDLSIGLLLPCNVTVHENDDSSITVSAVNPKEMFKIVENPALNDTVAEVDAKILRVMEKI